MYAARFDNYKDGQLGDIRFAGRCETKFQHGASGPVHLGDFDIDDISQVTPAHDSQQKLPFPFSWTHEAGPGAYTVMVQPADQGQEEYRSPDITDRKSYMLTSLPAGFSYNKKYAWIVVHINNDHVFCSSSYLSYVTFIK